MTIVVVGDALLDRDIHGSVDRLSPDAPVPVFDYEAEVLRAGGAGDEPARGCSQSPSITACGASPPPRRAR